MDQGWHTGGVEFYDPSTGRFTQEDPIGLAGGLNLYGFAGGDRVNYSDPFGLCPIEKDGVPCSVSYAAAGAAIGLGVGVTSGVATTVASVGVAAPTMPGQAAGAAALGAAIGGFVGSAIDNRHAIAAEMASAKDWLKRLLVGGAIWVGGGPPPRTTAGEDPPQAEQPVKPKEPPKGPKPKGRKEDPPQ